MAGIFNALKEFIRYKEPENSYVFELLESNENRQQNKEKQVKDTNKSDEKNQAKTSKEGKSQAEGSDKVLGVDLKVNLQRMKKEFNIPQNIDVVIREFKIARKVDAFIVFVDGMVNNTIVNDFILRQVMNHEQFENISEKCLLDYISDNVLAVNDTKKFKEFEKDIIPQILDGLTALFIDGCEEALIIESRGYEKRTVDKPITETVVRGSQEGFTEVLRTNTTLIRRIIKNKNLITETLPLGKTNGTSCAIMYLNGVANPKVVEEAKRRIKNINVDFMMGDGMLEQFIEDNPNTLFPQILNTERPDRAASFIMEGQVAIIVEGTPFVNIVPVTFWHLMNTSEDTTLRWQYGTLLRLIRGLGFLFAVFLPGLYVAVTLYHQEMIPSNLLISIAKSRENVPFPVILEVLLMELSFELIREAGIRVPGVIGYTIGIIGALILGQAAVEAQIVSPILIIIVAVTGLGNFAIPSYPLALAVRILRFIFIAFGGLLGFYGIAGGVFILGSIGCHMKSFGVPFFSPVAPKTKGGNDTILRRPLWKQENRPDTLGTPDRRRQPAISRKWSTEGEGTH